MKLKDVNGNVDVCGFPARRESTPGSCSRGRHDLTGFVDGGGGDGNVNLVVTSGGTGFAVKDKTPEVS